MSVAPIAAPTVEEGPSPVGPAAAAQRIQQLQDLIAKVETGPAGFAAALQAAQASTAPAGTAQTAGAQTPGMQTTAAQALPAGTYPTATGAGAIPTATSGEALPTATGAGAIPTTNTLPTTTPVAYTPASTPLTASSSGATGSEYDALIEQAAARNGVDPAVLHGLIQQESGFDPNSTSSAGALGLTQLMPGTASSLGVTDPLDPAQSIEGGARYLGEMLRQFGGNTEDALAAYNAGPGAVQRYGGVPPYSETQQYVTKVLGYASEYRQSHPTATIQPDSVASPQAAIA